MGFRYRKSKKLPGGFRINFSKSGIGYSWGFKGYRKTKMANGRTRTTYSIPGTGISYVEEMSSNSKNRTNNDMKISIPRRNIKYDVNEEKVIINTFQKLSAPALKVYSIIHIIAGIMLIIMGIIFLIISPLAGLIVIIIGIFSCSLSKKYLNYRRHLLDFISQTKL